MPNAKKIENANSHLDLILNAQKIVLTTHRNSDGDGIGSLVALYWALQSLNKLALFFPVDEIPKRYSYMLESVEITTSLEHLQADLLIILDTNQGELCNPLFDHQLKQNCHILFIDHHIDQFIEHSQLHRHINVAAASTGEIVFDLIQDLGVRLNDQMANALYSSLTFDTQAFKLVKNSSRSHAIAAQLAEYKINTEKIQRALFAHWTPEKMSFLAELIKSAKYFSNNQVVGLNISQKQLEQYKLSGDDVSDLLDLFTLIPTVKLAYLIRESKNNEHKLSFRSSLTNYAYLVALQLGGGGHSSSSGAWIKNSDFDSIEELILKELKNLLLI